MITQNEIQCDKVMKIKPLDTLFFGSGRSFNKMENNWLSTMLIPHPSVFYGAICSVMLANNQYRRNQYVYNKNLDSDPRRYLQIKSIYLYDDENDDIYIKAPLDLYVNEKGKVSYSIVRKIKDNINCSVKDDMQYLFFNNPKGESQRCDDMFIKQDNFYNSYYDNIESIDVLKVNEVFENSYKVGIQIDNNRVTKEGYLYRIDVTEFKDKKWSYLIEYGINNTWWKEEEIKFLSQGYLKLGGENKACQFYTYNKNKKVPEYSRIYQHTNNTTYVKMVLTSPCVFNNSNWKPNLNEKIKVVAATTGKPYNLGGFDIVINQPRPMYKIIPQGSVYILESELFRGKSLLEIKKIIENQDIMKKIPGFGEFEIVPVSEYQMEGIEE